MQFVQVESFLRVAEEGNMTRAAARLHLTQPAVTKHIRALEREVGAPLFDRVGRGVELTPAGAALQEYARRSMALLDEGRQVVTDLQRGAVGRVVIGAGVTTSIFQLPRWLRKLQDDLPGMEIVVRTGRSRQVAEQALAREIDLGLVTSPMAHPDLVVRDLYEEEILLVTPPNHPLAGRSVAPAELAAEPLILFPRATGFREYLDRALQEAGIQPRVKMESDSAEAIKSFVEVGLGASFLPAAAVQGELASGALSRAAVTGLAPLRRCTAVVYRRDRRLNPGARALLEMLCE